MERDVSLCLSCGFCCDGTLFDRVPLVETEVAALAPVLHVAPGAHHARQPCPALDGRACRVYGDRPLTCRRFRCLLLEAHEADEVSLAGAVEIVDATRALRAKVAEALGVVDAGTVVEAARAPGVPREAAEALERLDRHLAFHFLGQRSRHAR
jgi:Fe-S-cluster containining protein